MLLCLVVFERHVIKLDLFVFFFKQKTAYEMRISDWSSDVCSSDLGTRDANPMNVVVVESPAKAKTINKYLGPGYRVLASYGHVRDLPAKDGSVEPERDFAMSWEVDADARKRIDAIAHALANGDRLYLATDTDRAGEAISWHVKEVLRRRGAREGVDVKRVVFPDVPKKDRKNVEWGKRVS